MFIHDLTTRCWVSCLKVELLLRYQKVLSSITGGVVSTTEESHLFIYLSKYVIIGTNGHQNIYALSKVVTTDSVCGLIYCSVARTEESGFLRDPLFKLLI